MSACVSIRACASGAGTAEAAYVSIRRHTSAYVSIWQQHTSAYVSIPAPLAPAQPRHSTSFLSAYVSSIRQHTSAYVSIRHSTSFSSAYVSIRQHTSAYVSIPAPLAPAQPRHSTSSLSAPVPASARPADVIRQHTSAYVSIRQHLQIVKHPFTSAYVSIRQHTSAYVSIRQHTSAPADREAPIYRARGQRRRA
jgi:hypothetical protein